MAKKNNTKNAIFADAPVKAAPADLVESVESAPTLFDAPIKSELPDDLKVAVSDKAVLLSENARLTNENAKLTEQLAKYIDEVNELKLNKTNPTIIAENKKLKTDNYKLMEKVSSLLFEVSVLKQNANGQTSNKNNISLKPTPGSKKVMYHYRPKHNGYNDWN